MPPRQTPSAGARSSWRSLVVSPHTTRGAPSKLSLLRPQRQRTA
eukprot:CAMPEP_0179892954 /NCGR_PEP_ID=MMETSP0982-20121206/34519_1 /TAXON_ID=483367 /ORGANISM="non described non described, Strain CCMP 2436" /LENGTH=43 /DNA_ID= /DNA_START= /DNA_END= /DNA_ORIENTATION=